MRAGSKIGRELSSGQNATSCVSKLRMSGCPKMSWTGTKAKQEEKVTGTRINIQKSWRIEPSQVEGGEAKIKSLCQVSAVQWLKIQ